MRGAVIHGILLAVMLVYGYRTWTRDKTIKPDIGKVVLWDKPESDLVSIEYKAHGKEVKLERKSDASGPYWWGSETTITYKPAPQPAKTEPEHAGSGSAAAGSGSAAAGSGSGSAASGSGSGSAAKPEPPKKPEEVEDKRTTREFPVADGPTDTATKILQGFAAARAIEDLGTLTPDQKKEYKLDDTKDTLTVTFKDGARTFLIGGAVYAGTDKYAIDQTTGKAYVLSRELLSGLEIGESSLHLTEVRGFEATKIGHVTIESNGRVKQADRLTTTDADGKELKTWGEPGSKKGNQTLANFIDGLARLLPSDYDATLKPADMTLIMKVTYADDHGAKLGTLALYKFEKAGELAPGQTLDPANPPKGDVEYYIVTEKTRVPALVRKDLAQRAESDIETVFSNKPDDENAGSGLTPGKAAPPPPPGLMGTPPPAHPLPNPTASPPPAPAPGKGSGSAAAAPGKGSGSAAAAPGKGSGSAAPARPAVDPHALERLP